MRGFLLDTNVISEATKPKPEPKVARWLDELDEDVAFLSVLTLGEIRRGVLILQPSRRRTRLEIWLERELRGRFAGRILPVDELIADRWGTISAAAGRSLPVIDGLLAATALHYNLTLVTRNTRDVAATGVAAFNPWE